MLRRLVMLCLLFTLAAPAGAKNQTPPPKPAPPPAAMTLQQAVNFALEHNTSVLQARSQAMAAGASLARDRSFELPLVNANAQSILTKQSTNNAGSLAQFNLTPSATFSQNTAQLQGSATIINFTAWLEAKQAKRFYDAALQTLRLTREQTILSVDTAFFTYVQDADLLLLAVYDEHYQRELRDIAEANFKTGKVAGIDRLKAQVQLISSQQRLASAKANAEDARENLAQAIGADSGQQFAIEPAIATPPLPPLDLRALESVALLQRPEVAVAQANLDSARFANQLVDAPNRPTVQLTGGWGNLFSSTVNARTIASFDQCIMTPGINPSLCVGPGPSHFYNIGVSSVWTLPLLDWGSTSAAHRSARAAIDSMQAQLDASRRQAQIDVDQAVRRVEVQRENLALATSNINVAKDVAQTAQVQYKVGLISQIDVTSSEQTYLQAAKELLDAQVGYVLAIEKLKLATGTLL